MKLNIKKAIYRIQAGKNILELGTSLGINTLYLASNPNINKVLTIEGCTQIAEVAKNTIQGIMGDKITIINTNISNAFLEVSYHVSKLDFILIDANHTYEATIQYYKSCKEFVHEDTIIIIDDIYWPKGMKKAWKEIKQDIMVTLSIDLFEMGIIFFKKKLQKENYVLSW